jgi:hypothetical protein
MMVGGNLGDGLSLTDLRRELEVRELILEYILRKEGIFRRFKNEDLGYQ